MGDSAAVVTPPEPGEMLFIAATAAWRPSAEAARERQAVAIADLYDPDTMPAGLREAHERNDDVLERIYIGRRFRNDTERLEKLFELYTRMTAGKPAKTAPARRTGGKVDAAAS